MQHYAAFHLGLHCLQSTRSGVSQIQRVKLDLTWFPLLTTIVICSLFGGLYHKQYEPSPRDPVKFTVFASMIKLVSSAFDYTPRSIRHFLKQIFLAGIRGNFSFTKSQKSRSGLQSNLSTVI